MVLKSVTPNIRSFLISDCRFSFTSIRIEKGSECVNVGVNYNKRSTLEFSESFTMPRLAFDLCDFVSENDTYSCLFPLLSSFSLFSRSCCGSWTFSRHRSRWTAYVTVVICARTSNAAPRKTALISSPGAKMSVPLQMSVSLHRHYDTFIPCLFDRRCAKIVEDR